MRGMMVGADEHRDMLAMRTPHQRVAHGRPRDAQALARHREPRADLVSLRRQLPDEHLPAAGASPTKQVPPLAALTTPAPPQHPATNPKHAPEHGPGTGVPDPVGDAAH